MIKKIIPILALAAVLVTACGGQAEPTLSAEQIQGTAVAAAFTMVAQTQAAIPTNTPLPPTETASPTPLPTFTLAPSATPDFALLPTATQAAASSGGEDNCLHPINRGEAGPTSNIRFENETGGRVTLSLNLQTNLHGQCGAETYIIEKNGKTTLSMPKGEYFAYAWVQYANGSSSTAVGYVNNRVGDNHGFVVKIKPDIIVTK